MLYLPKYQIKMRPATIIQYISITLLFLFTGNKLQARGEFVNTDSLFEIASSMNPEDGISFLLENADNCRTDSDRDECVFKIFFSAGYLSQKAMLNSRGVDRDRYAEYAMRFYGKAYTMRPGNVQLLTNLYLLLRSQNNYERSLKILDKLIEADSENEGRYLSNKAEIFSETGDQLNAALFYGKAFFKDRNETECWNAFNEYNNIESLNEFYSGINSFIEELKEQGEYDLARQGYLFALKKAVLANDLATAGEASVAWLDVLSHTPQRINSSVVNELPDTLQWRSESNVFLHKLFTEPLNFLKTQKNRQFNPKERHLIATVLSGLESEAVMKGDIRYAIQLLEEGFAIAPWFYEYHSEALKDLFPVQTTIALELARLYTTYPEFDPDNSKFNDLIRELFNEKASHYRQKDIEAIIRSHTVLGLIYAERNVWRSDWRPGNAIYQLEHAIAYQKELEKKDPSNYKPVPSIYQTLAKGYAITGQKEREASALINAAKGYLDIDYIKASEKYVKRAAAAQALNTNQSQLLNALNSIIDLRSDILDNKINFREDPAILEQTITGSVLFADSARIPDKSFLNRQRFKVLSDVGQKVSEANPGYTYPLFEIKALKYLKREKSLGSNQDIERINHIEKTFKMNLEDRNVIKVRPDTRIIDKSENAKNLHLNTGESNTTVEVNNDLFIIGRLYEAVSTQNRNTKELKDIRVRQGYVTIPEAGAEQQTIDKNRIQEIHGVKRVRTIPR